MKVLTVNLKVLLIPGRGQEVTHLCPITCLRLIKSHSISSEFDLFLLIRVLFSEIGLISMASNCLAL
jgi:hypothetical protein